MFRFTNVIRGRALTAGGAFDALRLPSDPLQAIFITIRCLNMGARATFANILNVFANLSVNLDGSPVMSGTAADLYRLAAYIQRQQPDMVNDVKTDNGIRRLTLPILFGRMPFFPDECLPSTRAGSLNLIAELAGAFTNLDTVTVDVDALTLPDAEPSRYLLGLPSTFTPAATGDMDVDVPIGNVLVGSMFFGTTIPNGLNDVSTINRVHLFADEERIYYHDIARHAMQGAQCLTLPPLREFDTHLHESNGAAPADVSVPAWADSLFANYLFADLDPLRDGRHALPTAGIGSLKWRVNAGDTNPARITNLYTIPLPESV